MGWQKVFLMIQNDIILLNLRKKTGVQDHDANTRAWNPEAEKIEISQIFERDFWRD